MLYRRLRNAFPDFRPEIHWQTVDGDVVTTFKTYHGTHEGAIFGIEPTGRVVQFDTVDAMRVRAGKMSNTGALRICLCWCISWVPASNPDPRNLGWIDVSGPSPGS